MAAHELELSDALKRLDRERDKQSEALRKKLAERRRAKEAALRQKHTHEVSAQLNTDLRFVNCR